jgi:adenine-specific DNA methylase
MSKSAYSIIAQDCESSDYIVRHSKIKAVKPAKAKAKVLIIEMNPSLKAEVALDEYCLDRDSVSHETIIPWGCHGHEVLDLNLIAQTC